MNCNSCGAAMELYAERGYFFCRYCGSFHFPQTAGDDGIRVLADSPEALECPGCSKPLATATLDGAHAVHYCRNCRGVLLARRIFAEVVRMRRAWASGTPSTPAPPKRHELERRVACPNCRTRMLVHPYYGPGNIVMDSCERCDAVWLDFGELRQIVDAPGSDRGRRDVPQRSVTSTPDDAKAGSGVGDALMSADVFIVDDAFSTLRDILS
jgi:Zn-finger nucleic acid-binding protein